MSQIDCRNGSTSRIVPSPPQVKNVLEQELKSFWGSQNSVIPPEEMLTLLDFIRIYFLSLVFTISDTGWSQDDLELAFQIYLKHLIPSVIPVFTPRRDAESHQNLAHPIFIKLNQIGEHLKQFESRYYSSVLSP